MTSDGVAAITVKPRQRDEGFYIDFIIFEVEGVLFRVPRHPFQTESEVFRDMLSLPLTDKPIDGISDDSPLVLHGVSAKDFRALLRALFRPVFGSQKDLNEAEWISVLCLSRLWNFDKLFNIAIDMLDRFPVDPTTKTELAKKHYIKKWLRHVYYDLVMRLKPLTLADADMLGVDCVLKLAQIREMRFRWIIEGRDSEPPRPSLAAISTPTFTELHQNTPASEIGLDPTVFSGYVKDIYAERLKKAVRDAITDVFGLDRY